MVENQGRIAFGKNLKDFKGILSEVKLGSKTLEHWNMKKVFLSMLDEFERMPSRTLNSTNGAMTVWTGTFKIPCEEEAKDTFLRFNKWTKGIAYVNAFGLGRYWPRMGPQETLYLPAPVLLGKKAILGDLMTG